ncbi:MAG: hypothetical protein HQL87_03105 [Magnetococcales bacterium]|nr:hypothetical protein [Magnetococcales bacterium]
MMNVTMLPVSEIIPYAGVDRATIIRPLKNKFARVTPARSFDVGWNWMDVAAVERKSPPYRSRYGRIKTTLAPTDASSDAVPPQADDSSDQEPVQEISPQTGGADTEKTVRILEEQNAFLRARLVAAEENFKALLGLLADRDRR